MNRKHTMLAMLAVMACSPDAPLGELETAPEAFGPPAPGAQVIDFKTAPMAEVERAAKEVEAGGLASVDEVVYARAHLDSLQGPHGPALAARWGIPLEEAIAIEAGFLDFVTDFLTPTLTTAQHLEQLGEIRAERLEELDRLIEAGDEDGVEHARERLETLDKIISHYSKAGGDLGSLSYSGYDCPGTPRIESMKNGLRHYTRQNQDGEDRLYVAVHSMHYVYPAAQTTVSQTFLRAYGEARGSTVKLSRSV